MNGRRWVLGGLVWLALATTATAQEATFPPGGLTETLKARIGKPVTLHLDSGATLGGAVAEVRDRAVVIRGISGREYSDALVALDHVVAVEVRR